MEAENQSSTEIDKSESDTLDAMAPLQSEAGEAISMETGESQDMPDDDGVVKDGEPVQNDSQEGESALDSSINHTDDDALYDVNEKADYNEPNDTYSDARYSKHSDNDNMVNDDDGELPDDDDGELAEGGEGCHDAEDGEILEDGEIASDQDGEIDDSQEEHKGDKSDSNKSSPSKRGHHDSHGKRSHSKKDRHSKRRRTSKEDSYRESKQKKKRHRDYDGEEYESGWVSDSRREKSERKRDRSSPGYDKDADKRRRGSGEKNRHQSGRDRESEKSRDRNHHDSKKDRSERHDKPEKDRKDRDRHSREKDRKNYGVEGKNFSDGGDYSSPPGLYDSPSDEEYDSQGRPKTLMALVEDQYVDPLMAEDEEPMLKQLQAKKSQQKRTKDFVRRRRDRENDDDHDQPAKKKPLLQTPMEERPICKFFKEGKCQKGDECPFNHDYQPQKRLELCKYYVQSYCKRDGCVFMHEEFPCKYYHQGMTCYQGDNCKFSHEPLNEETGIALQNILQEEGDFEVQRKPKKKGLLGDSPSMSEDQIKDKLEKMKSIPSIFDIQTHAPGQSPKPPKMKGPGPNMSPQMRFPNGPPPNARFPFMGPGGPGMDGPPPPMGMGPPPISGTGILGQGPPPMMAPAPGMQGPPMGPPMSQAAALVGALLRAAPMLQQYRGPNQQGPMASSGANTMNAPSDPRYMNSNMENSNMMGPGGMNMNNQNMMGPGMMGMDNQNMMGPGMDNQSMMGPGPGMGQNPMLSPGQDNQQGMMIDNQNMNDGQAGFSPSDAMPMQKGHSLDMTIPPPQLQQQQSQNQANPNRMGSRDPRKAGPVVNDPRLAKAGIDSDSGDVDMRKTMGNPAANMGDEDLRQDVDMRQDNDSNKGDNTPTQNWDETSDGGGNEGEEDSEILAKLPPKQREMFMRIRQHTQKMKREKEQQKPPLPAERPDNNKMDDDKWYSSDEEEENKPNINNILNSLGKSGEAAKSSVTSSPVATSQSSINVMQMINAIKAQPATTTSRPLDPRKQMPPKPAQQTTYIESQEGDCPWRLCKVLYVKNRIPSEVDLNDERYKSDPRVQKILKLQELESGKVIDHTKGVTTLKQDPSANPFEPKLPDLLDPKVFKAKEATTRPELAPFVDPRAALSKAETSPAFPTRPQDPRMKPTNADPRVLGRQSSSNAQNMPPSRPFDPRMSRQDSNSSIASIGSTTGAGTQGNLKPFDPRIARQTSLEPPPMDPRMLNRQSSNDPRMAVKPEPPSLDISNINLGKPDPRLARVLDSEINQMAYQRQNQSSPTPSMTSSNDSNMSVDKEPVTSDSAKPKLDYRNDPRFKRKHISEAKNLSPDAVGKRYSGQRKSSTEYSSPLGGDGGAGKSEDSGYNSYNRPRPPKPAASSQPPAPSVTKSDSVVQPSGDLSTHDILDSLQIIPPEGMAQSQGPDKNLKDIFKTIDPTASPFC